MSATQHKMILPTTGITYSTMAAERRLEYKNIL